MSDQVLITLTSGAAAGTIVSALFNWYNTRRQKDLEVEYDYKKYIVEKRKKAYDHLEAFMGWASSNLVVTYIYENIKKNEKKNWIKQGNELSDKLKEVRLKGMWMSKNTETHIRQMISLVHDTLERYVSDAPVVENEITDHYNELLNAFDKLESLYFDDLISLKDSKRFLKENVKKMRDRYRLRSGPFYQAAPPTYYQKVSPPEILPDSKT